MPKFPAVQGVIDRRILVNFRIDPEVLAHELPPPFKPKLVEGFGIAGICLIRLKQIRPDFINPAIGIGSENAAHRIAVVWEQAGNLKEGVFIPRRDTSSQLNALIGGRLFPGEHHQAQFYIDESSTHYRVAMESRDGAASVVVAGQVGDSLPEGSVFENLQAASDFFEGGSLGYSRKEYRPGEYEGLELRTLNWEIKPLSVTKVKSSYFSNPNRFPKGTIEFDNALLMTGIDHEWHGQDTLYVEKP